MTIDKDAVKAEFIDMLRSTGREGVDYVIEEIERLGFFEAPASANHHLNVEGGLTQHSLNVAKAALSVWEALKPLEPTLEKEVTRDSIIISALLHDVCKADIYKKVTKKVRNEIGVWEAKEAYNIDYSDFPLGHGEKSVIMLLRSGLDLNDDEIMAIRWHMGSWDIAFQSSEMVASNRKAKEICPLLSLIHTADTLAAGILEGKG